MIMLYCMQNNLYPYKLLAQLKHITIVSYLLHHVMEFTEQYTYKSQSLW